jgi:hypothetical protein
MQLRTLRASAAGRTDEVVLAILRQAGPQTLDALASATGLEWAQTFATVDRLSRAGSIALHRAGACGYRASLGSPAR